MQLVPYLLVIVSVFTHGIWNFLAKQGQNKDVFIGLSLVSSAVMFFIPYLVLLQRVGYGTPRWPLFAIVAAVISGLNYFFLMQAYKHIELSVAYPIARASTLFLPFLAYAFIGERIDTIGIISIGLITVAVLGFQLESFSKAAFLSFFRNLMRPGILYALLTALTVAGYTLWDKVAVTDIHPFLYFYSYTSLIALVYGAWLLTKAPRADIRMEWQARKLSIVMVGFLNMFTYVIVLFALEMSKATYVGGLRQLSLVVGMFLGWKFLNEEIPFPRIVSVILLIIGSSLIVFAR